MTNLARIFRRMSHRMKVAVPVLLDIAGLTLIAMGVFLLETGRPGWWSIVAGVGLILAAIRAQS